MSELADAGNLLLEQAKAFLAEAKKCKKKAGQTAFSNAALLISFAALEAYINSACEDFLTRSDLTPHEKGLLSEREVKFQNGAFMIGSNLKMIKIEDKLDFLYEKFSTKKIDKTESYWNGFKVASQLRNSLTHPKAGTLPEVTPLKAENALVAIITLVDFLYKALYRRKLPKAAIGLDSRISLV